MMKMATGAWILFSSTLALAGGGMDGGGGKGISDENNPWFLGSAPIEYCVHVDTAFSVDPAQVRTVIREAFDEWKTTLQKYGIYNARLSDEFEDGKVRALTSDAVEVAECTDPAHQLDFKIGIVDEQIGLYLKENGRKYVGFAWRGEYDHTTFRSGGTIWIAPENWIGPVSDRQSVAPRFPEWQSKNRLKHVILHEIGHVLGFPHTLGTVMDEGIYSRLVFNHTSLMSPPMSGIETNTQRLNPFLDQAPIVDTHNGFFWKNALQMLGHDVTSDPWMRTDTYFESTRHSRYFMPQWFVKFVMVTQKGRRYELTTELIKGVDQVSNQYVSFFSPKFGRAKRDDFETQFFDFLSLDHNNSTMMGYLRIGEYAAPITISFSGIIFLYVATPISASGALPEKLDWKAASFSLGDD